MKYYNYTDLGIVSAKKPFNAHLFWEHSTYGLILVDSADQTKLFISTDKGDNWAEIDLSDNTNSFKIQAGWLDGNDLWLVMCDNDGIETEFEVCFVELDDSNDCNPIDVQATSAGDPMLVYDIFKLGSDFYVYWNDAIGVGEVDWITEVTVSPFVAKDDVNTAPGRTTHVVVVGTKAYWWKSIAPFTSARTGVYDSTIPAITFPFNVITTHFIKTDTNFRSQSYDGSDFLYAILEQNIDGKNYLISFSITEDAYTVGGEQNVILMLDRNTASGVLEKAFHLTEYKIYQLHENIPHQLYLIAIPDTDNAIIGITDNFFMNDDGDMWEYGDVIGLILSLYIDHQIEEASHCIFKITKDDLLLSKNMLIRFYHNYTTSGATSEEIVFEGIIVNFDDLKRQTVWCMSPAKREIKDVKPSGDYTKDSDGLISQLIIDYCNYITEGTLTDGADLGTIALGGNLNLETILDDCKEFEAWIWYLDPTGKLYFNNGTTDSTINYSQNDGLTRVRPSYVHEEFNKIKVRGAYVDGVQIESDWQEDLDSQDQFGINEKIIDVAFLNTVALCNIAATNLLTILAKDPKKVTFSIRDTTAGLILPGETITFEYNNLGIVIASDQFLIRSAVLDKNGLITYTIVDELT